jgi:hypothetical protein
VSQLVGGLCDLPETIKEKLNICHEQTLKCFLSKKKSFEILIIFTEKFELSSSLGTIKLPVKPLAPLNELKP